jgi:hypothetical protein
MTYDILSVEGTTRSNGYRAAMYVRTLSWVAPAWGIGGTLLLLTVSVWRLSIKASGLHYGELEPYHWAFGLIWLAFMVYTEAWRGFHKQFAPRVVQRALDIPRPFIIQAAAPVVCMGLLHATPRRLFISRALVVGIVILVQIIRITPSPWRELVDLGVAIGLGLGTLSLYWHAALALAGKPPGVSTDYPSVTTTP